MRKRKRAAQNARGRGNKMKSIYETIGGTYTQQGDYTLPNLTVPKENARPTGVWAQRREGYLKHNRKVRYYNLLTTGRLNAHLTDIEQEAKTLFCQLVNQYAEEEGVTEALKAADMMQWVRKMNAVRQRAAEIVREELICV